MCTQYLRPTDKDAFLDFPGKKSPQLEYNLTFECPKCTGYGGWNLRLNAYPLGRYVDTPENRHLYSHFRASCNNCNGWGYVTPTQGEHIHHWVRLKNVGRCLNLWQCETCGEQEVVDSSD